MIMVEEQGHKTFNQRLKLLACIKLLYRTPLKPNK